MALQYAKHGSSLIERLEMRSMPVPECGCIFWMGAINTTGYGVLRIKHRTVLAHRMAWACYVGPIPSGINVLHRCDTPLCINPDHLFLGTHKDNTADMIRKMRHAHGPALSAACRGKHPGMKHGRAKLTDAQVLAIRKTKGSCAAIGMQYGVSATTINGIRKGKSWVHLPFVNSSA